MAVAAISTSNPFFGSTLGSGRSSESCLGVEQMAVGAQGEKEARPRSTG